MAKNGMDNDATLAFVSGSIGKLPLPKGLAPPAIDRSGETVAAHDGSRRKDALRGEKTAYEYWENELLKSITNPLGNRVSFFYDAKGNLTRCENPNGTTVEFDYAENDLLRTHICKNSRGEITASYTFSYTPSGSVGEVIDNVGRSVQYAHDPHGRLSGSVDTNNPAMVGGFRISHSRNAGERSDVVKLTGGETRTFEWSADGKLTTLFLSDSESHAVRMLSGEDPRRAEVTTPGGVTVNHVYDKEGRIVAIENALSAMRQNFTYAYDANGNTARENDVRFSYSALNRLTAWHDPSREMTTDYVYDMAGNLLSVAENGLTLKSFRYDDANRITNEGFRYDANGNLTGNGQYSYAYDPLNRLSQVRRNGCLVASYEYDYLGRRIKSIEGCKVTYCHYDGTRVLAESDETGRIIARYAYDDEGRLVSMTRKGKAYFYLFNARGDVVALTNSDGHIVNTYAYDPWGKITAAEERIENPYRYAGYRYDEATGLYYLIQRYYDPEIARFLSKDALFDTLVREADFHNAYTYASNNPTSYVDPCGAWGERIHKGVTEECAKQLGYAPDDIEAIARATVDTDTSPGNCYSDVPGKHINKHWLGWLGVRLPDQLKYANEEFARAKELQTSDKKQSLQHLGQGLHSLQDYYAHGTFPPYGWHTLGPWNGLMPWYSADDPDSALNRRRAQKAAEATIEYLEDYLA